VGYLGLVGGERAEDTTAVTEALGLDERGLAAASVNADAGGEGPGFVRINGSGTSGDPIPNFVRIQTVAEHRRVR